MSKDVYFLTPESSAGTGGLADYALRVAEQWGARARIHLTDSPNELPARNGRVLLHYSAYGFDRRGYPRDLLRALVHWKKNSSSRLVLMLHEIWTFWPRLNKNRLLQRWHRDDLRELVAVADAVFTSTPSQAEHLQKLVPAKAIAVLPVGSNIRRLALANKRIEGLAILFGLQSSRVRALRQLQNELRELARTKIIRRLLTIGQGDSDDLAERKLLEEIAPHFEMKGALPEAEISALLSRASFGISGQDELSIYKSGTFMAYAAHGLNIISPAANPRGAAPLCWLTSADELQRGLAASDLKTRAQHLQSWQEQTSSWAEIARQFAEALELA